MIKKIVKYINNQGRFNSPEPMIENTFWFTFSSYISLINPTILLGSKELKVNYFGLNIVSSGRGKSFTYEQCKKLFDTNRWYKALNSSYKEANKELPNDTIMIEGEESSLINFLPNFENNIEGTKEGLYLRALALSKAFTGSLNIVNEEIMDIIASSNINSMKELYDGQLLGKVIKGSINQNIYGINSNMLVFGSSVGLKRDAKTYEFFVKAMNSGIYRRSFIYYEEPSDIEPKVGSEEIEIDLSYINDFISENKKCITEGKLFILEPTEEAKEYLDLINIELVDFANQYKEDERFSAEIGSFDKIVKLAGLNALLRASNEISYDDIDYAYKFYKSLRETNIGLFNIESQHKRIYKVIKNNKKITKSEILEKDLFNRSTFNEDMLLIEELCYRKNERLVITGSKIKMYSIEPIQKNNLNKIIVSTPKVDKKEKTTEYNSFELPLFGDGYSIEKLVTADTITNFCLVHFKDGKRSKKNVIEKINCIGLDIDLGSLDEAIKLLEEQKIIYLIYTTKSHQKDKGGIVSDRFRILLPLKSIIEIDSDRYEYFVENLANAINLNIYDKNAKDISRLWFNNPNAEIYKNQDGVLIDPIPFLPDTETEEIINDMSERYIENIDDEDEVGRRINGMIRWTIANTYKGNRNTNLFKFAMFVKDLTGSVEIAKQAVIDVNEMICEPLGSKELKSTILKSINR